MQVLKLLREAVDKQAWATVLRKVRRSLSNPSTRVRIVPKTDPIVREISRKKALPSGILLDKGALVISLPDGLEFYFFLAKSLDPSKSSLTITSPYLAYEGRLIEPPSEVEEFLANILSKYENSCSFGCLGKEMTTSLAILNELARRLPSSFFGTVGTHIASGELRSLRLLPHVDASDLLNPSFYYSRKGIGVRMEFSYKHDHLVADEIALLLGGKYVNEENPDLKIPVSEAFDYFSRLKEELDSLVEFLYSEWRKRLNHVLDQREVKLSKMYGEDVAEDCYSSRSNGKALLACINHSFEILFHYYTGSDTKSVSVSDWVDELEEAEKRVKDIILDTISRPLYFFFTEFEPGSDNLVYLPGRIGIDTQAVINFKDFVKSPLRAIDEAKIKNLMDKVAQILERMKRDLLMEVS